MGIFVAEIGKIEWTEEEKAEIAQLVTDILDLLAKSTKLSRNAKLWVLAQLAYQYMEYCENFRLKGA